MTLFFFYKGIQFDDYMLKVKTDIRSFIHSFHLVHIYDYILQNR